MSQRFILPDGRALAYDELGPATGTPVFFFHGVLSSRLDWRLFDGETVTHTLGLRLIAVDRPATGGSDFQTRRRLTDWPEDVAAQANGLGLDRFAVLGYSGGGPYALACACYSPERLTAVGVASSECRTRCPA